MPIINFENEHRVINVLPGTNLRKAALKAGVTLYKPLYRVFHVNLDIGPISLNSSTDVVEVVDGKGVNARTEQEEMLVGGRFLKRKVAPGHRLASQVTVNGDVTVRTMPKRELDLEATKHNLGFLAAVGTFFLFALGLFLVLGLELVKKI